MSTPTITLSQLHSDLLRIYAHGLSPTNVTEIQYTAGGAVYFVTDTSELEANLAQAEAKRATAERALATANGRIETLENYIHDLEDKPTASQPERKMPHSRS